MGKTFPRRKFSPAGALCRDRLPLAALQHRGMPEFRIERIDSNRWENEIDRVFKSAYRAEAELLGVDTFPPLERSKADLSACGNTFIGYLRNGLLLGVLEIEPVSATQHIITALAVTPRNFRQGIGKSLVRYALAKCKGHISVATGARNEPAIGLYSALGFELTRRFKTLDGIEMVEFSTG